MLGAIALAIAALLLAGMAAPARAQLAGDCDGDGAVSISELIQLVNIALGNSPLSGCPAGDADGDGSVSIAELIAAVTNAICNGPCPTAVPTATATPAPTPIGNCGDGVLDPGEQCDGASDAACPGACSAPAPPAWQCVTCDASGAACSGQTDPTCPGYCVATTTACTCAPPALPQCQPGATDKFTCDPACAQAGARLFYREETAGSADFTEVEVVLIERPDPVNDPQRIRVAVRYQRPSGTDEFETSLTFSGGSGGILTPSAAGAVFRGLPIYTMLVCGWPLGCDDDSRPILANGDTYTFDLQFGFGPRREHFTLSCAGCGGGAARVNAAWAGVRCGEVAQLPTDLLCRDDNPTGSLVAPLCCGCPSDPICPDSTPICVNGVCQ